MSLPLPTEPLSTVDWLTLPDVPLAVVKHHGVTTGDLRSVFDASYGALGAAIAAGLITPAGPAIAVYAGDPEAALDVAIGFPVAEPLEASHDEGDLQIVHDHLVGGSYAAVSHVGSYDGLGAAWERLLEDVKEGGARPSGHWAEVYVTEPSPEADPATMRTDLLVPVVLDEIL
ncbi:AraC family transcriptional regulator [Serinibacter arcticus]|uniref:AraC family transcriptional regulator n=1 Tax=Serinibacter arcticus TaxID=1655435 RepID=A0A2U1ZT33_9MICO|nr:GyrI-like domain-containing protein [Serinibacter arcticus]PWD50136.1 AraC family transcriptional regulator [Serinibacter arcticus]